MNNITHIDRDFGWFVGAFNNNQNHKHYAIQLSIPLEREVVVNTPDASITTKQSVLIAPNVSHQFKSESPHFLLLINPASTVGHFWTKQLTKSIQEIENEITNQIKNLILSKNQSADFISEINKIILNNHCFCETALHRGDERINLALAYLDEHFDQVISLDEIASHCHLSPSRFLHLFKQETGITYRRAQLWNKLVKALPYFGKQSLTEIAHQNGFSDSAHLSRVFKENFGFGPREFLKLSQFIQV